jgi:hypothetical protein
LCILFVVVQADEGNDPGPLANRQTIACSFQPRNNEVVSVMTEQESAPPIFLVHGTWGRGFFPHDPNSPRRKRRFFPDRKKEWYEDGSPFHTKLSTELTKAGLSGSLRPFLWSGANSIKARDDAAEQFSTILTESLRDANSTPIIITHSHGGNVALLALSKLECSGSRVKLITMATPFLKVFPTERLNNPFLILFFIWVLGTISIVCAAAALFLVGIAITWALSVIFTANITLEHWPIWLWIAGGVVTLVVGYFFLNWAYSVFDPGTKRRDAIAKAAFYGPEVIPRMLVIRGVDDEAAMALVAGAIGVRLSRLGFTWMLAITAIFLLLGILLRKVIAIPDEWMTIAMDGMILLGVAFLCLPGFLKSVFGREFLIGWMAFETGVDSVPDLSTQISVTTFPPQEKPKGKPPEKMAYSRLRHGIYYHPRCVDEIVKWLGTHQIAEDTWRAGLARGDGCE